MHRFILLAVAVAVAGCSRTPTSATANFEPKSGSQITGTATFDEAGGSTTIAISAKALSPGKHAVAIHEKKVPEILNDAPLYALDLGALLAGTKFRGQFEERLKGVIKRLEEQPHAIMFIDEIHTIVGAGATSGGSMDASNILKPALASGEIRSRNSRTLGSRSSPYSALRRSRR